MHMQSNPDCGPEHGSIAKDASGAASHVVVAVVVAATRPVEQTTAESVARTLVPAGKLKYGTHTPEPFKPEHVRLASPRVAWVSLEAALAEHVPTESVAVLWHDEPHAHTAFGPHLSCRMYVLVSKGAAPPRAHSTYPRCWQRGANTLPTAGVTVGSMPTAVL